MLIPGRSRSMVSTLLFNNLTTRQYLHIYSQVNGSEDCGFAFFGTVVNRPATGKDRVTSLKREVLISEATIRKRVKEIADQISKDYQGTEPVLVGILKGSIIFMADLMRALTIPVQMDFIRAASYGSEMHSSGKVRVTKDIELPIEGKPVILIEDIVDSGLTLAYLKEKLKDRGALSLRICALIDKLERRECNVSVDYCGFQVEEGFLVGYGLDCNEEYRNLPEICVLKE